MVGNFQRVDSKSNTHAGRAFEKTAQRLLAQQELDVQLDFSVAVGVASSYQVHKFALGSNTPPIIVECKSHRWTTGDNVPCAKMTVWNQAMYYFQCSPKKFRKILCALKDQRKRGKITEPLSSYYIRT